MFFLDPVVLYAEDVESFFDALFAFRKASGFARVATDAFSEFATESIDCCDADILSCWHSQHDFADDPNDFLFVAYFFANAIVDASCWEVSFERSDILSVPVAEQREPEFLCWTVQTRS